MNLDLFINMVINSSVIASLLTALIFIFKLVFGKHISARWHYVIWFVLLLRLAVPYIIFSPFFISDLFKTASTVDGFADGIKNQTIISNPVSQSSALLGSIGQAFKTYISFILSNAETLFVIWTLGVVILSLYYFVYNSLFWRRVKNGTVFTDQNIIKLLEDCKHKLNVQTNISLIQTSGISIPAIFGVIRPWLLMPERVLKIMEYENLRYIILHELAHLKRKDIVINWISLILQIIHWFNPFVWFAFRRMRIDRELACDELVLLNLEQNEV
ncbi:MAG: M56 family metallopeptidase, partial [Bacteroidota bacterium]|nr:M56 family metallopeptidase [Bacteroidota bacterium]